MLQLVAMGIAALLGFIVWRDAQLLEERGVRVGPLPPAAWGIGTFLLAAIFGVLYLLLRFRAVHPPAGLCPNCHRALHTGDQFCRSCGCPLSSGADRDHQA